MLVAGGNKVNIYIEFFIESLLILHFVSLLIAATLFNLIVCQGATKAGSS